MICIIESEHFANMFVYGINYSKQIEENKTALSVAEGAYHGASAAGYLVGSAVLAPFTLGFSLGFAPLATIPVVTASEIEFNNGKGSTIKLVNEMRESDDKLSEKNT